MSKTISLFVFIFYLTITSIQAQSECQYYHRKACENKDNESMKYDSQSKSAVLGKGQISEFHMVAYDGLDYRISICSDEILGSQIQFKIYEKKRELIKAEEVEEVAYEEESTSEEEYSDDYSSDDDSYSDNTYSDDDSYSDDSYSDSYSDDAGFGGTADNKPKFRMVKELLYDNASDSYSPQIEFTAEGSMSLIIEVTVPGDESKGKLKIREMGCVGVLIEHATSKHAGF